MEKLGVVIAITLMVGMAMRIAHCSNEDQAKEVDEWFQKIPMNAKEKVTKLHFFFHERFAGNNLTAVRVGRATVTDTLATQFGLVSIMDDPLTEGSEPTSKEIGRAQGLYSFSGQDEVGILMVMNFVFTSGEFNGSSLTILGRVSGAPHGEMPIIGGSGVFRLARGVALADMREFDIIKTGHAIVEYNLEVIHY
ncbi:Plant disease resistance response protein [Corchorus olitorius]|uniref:Dirigent protein n=1 Tax=Corchorus olitorius TaxID=93759 RepID=A0A1R3GYN8_9ROSI|nr:Plant disease resistance response protein [Corchorus olitorius]